MNKNEIFLYAGTTFYETKRSSLESEIDLYLEYIKSLSIIKEFSNIFLNLTSSHENKINSILKNLDSKYQNNQSIKILKEIANIPLEILVDLLLNFNNKLKIYLPICSSGSFATLLFIPNIFIH